MKDAELKKEDTGMESMPAQEEITAPTDDEDIVEFEYNADGEEDLKATLKKLRKELKAEKTKTKEYLDNWQRERADFLNYKKDETERIGRTVNRAREHFAEEILPVLDSYDMAFSNKEAWEKVDKNWRIGVEYIHQQLLKVLSENGVEEIPTKIEDPFNPNLHQPIENIPTDEQGKDHTIERVIQKGYKNRDKTLRPARVNVWVKN